jgi:predicted nucleic acid-binding protein
VRRSYFSTKEENLFASRRDPVSRWSRGKRGCTKCDYAGGIAIRGRKAGARREGLTMWLDEEVPRRFEGRILGIDDAAAAEWGRTMARAERAGRPMSEMDAWLAALASVHHLVLVTRNGEDFSGFAGQIHNPWS